MKLLLVAPGYPPNLRGGIERSVQSLAVGLRDAGHAVVVVAGDDDFDRGFGVHATEVDGIRVHRIQRADLFYEHWQKITSDRIGAAFEAILQTEQPDVVHVHHWLRLSRDLTFRAARAGFPTVLTLHDLSLTCPIFHRVRPRDRTFCDSPANPDPCLRCAAALFETEWIDDANQTALLEYFTHAGQRELEAASRVLVLSSDQDAALNQFLGTDLRTEVCGLAVDTSGLTAHRRPAPEGRLRLGSWGTLHPLKGLDLLLDAVRRLEAPLRPEVRVAGAEVDAEFKQRLLERANGLDVVFHGEFDSLAEHPVTDVHCAVLTSRARETWSLVADEALALGLPILAPRFGAVPGRIPEGLGAAYYPVGDAGALARLIARLQEDPGWLADLREAIPAPVPTRSEFVERMLRIYTEVCGTTPPIAAEPTDGSFASEAWIEAWDRSCRAHRNLG